LLFYIANLRIGIGVAVLLCPGKTVTIYYFLFLRNQRKYHLLLSLLTKFLIWCWAKEIMAANVVRLAADGLWEPSWCNSFLWNKFRTILQGL